MSSKTDREYRDTIARHIKNHLDERYNTHADASSHAFSALYKSARLRIIFVTEGEGGRFASFIYRSCHNCLLNATRGVRRQYEADNTDAIEDLSHTKTYGDPCLPSAESLTESLGLPADPEDVMDYATHFARKYRSSKLLLSEVDFLLTRTPQDRAIYLLSVYYEALNGQQLADIIGLSRGVVYTRWHAMKQQLKERLNRPQAG